jgi:hypothetical protein
VARNHRAEIAVLLPKKKKQTNYSLDPSPFDPLMMFPSSPSSVRTINPYDHVTKWNLVTLLGRPAALGNQDISSSLVVLGGLIVAITLTTPVKRGAGPASDAAGAERGASAAVFHPLGPFVDQVGVRCYLVYI